MLCQGVSGLDMPIEPLKQKDSRNVWGLIISVFAIKATV